MNRLLKRGVTFEQTIMPGWRVSRPLSFFYLVVFPLYVVSQLVSPFGAKQVAGMAVAALLGFIIQIPSALYMVVLLYDALHQVHKLSRDGLFFAAFGVAFLIMELTYNTANYLFSNHTTIDIVLDVLAVTTMLAMVFACVEILRRASLRRHATSSQ